MSGHNIIVWDVTFALTDEDGEVISNAQGNVKLFRNDGGDYTHLAEDVELADLEEVSK